MNWIFSNVVRVFAGEYHTLRSIQFFTVIYFFLFFFFFSFQILVEILDRGAPYVPYLHVRLNRTIRTTFPIVQLRFLTTSFQFIF